MRRLLLFPLLLPLLALSSPASHWRSGWGLTGEKHAPSVAYRLPFDERGFRVGQAPGGHFSHRDAENRYAVDFTLPEGTPVLAARAGRVTRVQSGFNGNGLAPRDRERANYVRITHDDGSMAVYAHLLQDGVAVREGQYVDVGERIALSGNTGYSTAPHLHFAVQVQQGTELRSIPVRIVTPRGELHFPKGNGRGDDASGSR